MPLCTSAMLLYVVPDASVSSTCSCLLLRSQEIAKLGEKEHQEHLRQLVEEHEAEVRDLVEVS